MDAAMFLQSQLKKPNILKRTKLEPKIQFDGAVATQSHCVQRRLLKDNDYNKRHKAYENFLSYFSYSEKSDKLAKYSPKYYVSNDPEPNGLSNQFSIKDDNSDKEELKRIENVIPEENIKTASTETQDRNENKSDMKFSRCQYCSSEFVNKYDLLMHVQSHIQKDFYIPVKKALKSPENMKNEAVTLKPDPDPEAKHIEKVWYRKCFVPGCLSNTTRSPDKNYIVVPSIPDKRDRWFKAVNRNINLVSPLSRFYCCEDHFSDSQKYRIFEDPNQISISDDVVPHIFNQSIVKSETIAQYSKETVESQFQQLQNEKGFEIRIKIESDDTDWCIYDEDVKERKKVVQYESILDKPMDIHVGNDKVYAQDLKNSNENHTIDTKIVIEHDNSIPLNIENDVKLNAIPWRGEGETFKCGDCSSTFANEVEIFQHKRVWHGTTNKSRTSTTADLFKHEELIKVETKDINLLIEKEVFEKFDKFQREIAKKDKEVPLNAKKRHACPICKRDYSYNHFKAHMEEVHSQTEYICDQCGLRFKCQRYLRRHVMHRHGEGKPQKQNTNALKCLECPKTFKNSDCLSHHVRNCHGNKVECELCHSKLKSISYLKTHMRRVHYNDGKKHRCRICCKEFKSPRQVKIHMINLHPETLHPCPNCVRLFCSAVQLKIHMKSCKIKKEAGARVKMEDTNDHVIVD